MKIASLETWVKDIKKPVVIAGPCSAETEEQLLETSQRVKEVGVNIVRAGIWKPRTRPNNFEGIGEEGLRWIQNVRKETKQKFAVEVATPKHVYEAIKYNVDMLWVGARSTTNPFAVQEIAEALRGADVPVLIKNPINPDLALWMGAIERISNVGITKIGAIHRGFSSFKQTKFRNLPMWQIPLELKRKLPNLPLICDPSHIAGQREMIFELSQNAIDLDYDGLIIETHRDPENAWSDAAQQITPESLGAIIKNLKYRKPTSKDKDFITVLTELREQIDHVDKELFEIISQRMDIVDQMGRYKKKNNVTVFQKNRWQQISESRSKWAEELGLNPEFMWDLFKLIHDASIRRQEYIMNTIAEESNGESK